MYANSLIDDEYWLRCPQCGDSKNHPDKAHLSINITKGVFHCLRCGYGGKMRGPELLLFPEFEQVMFKHDSPEPAISDLTVESIRSLLVPGPASDRRTPLDRRHVFLRGHLADVFQSREPTGELGGFHLRFTKAKRMLTVGKRLLGYSGDGLVESNREFIRLVEGPYDVIDPFHDVCTFGLPSIHQLRMLSAWPLVLCPDGDIWNDHEKLSIYLKTVSLANPLVSWIEYLPDDKDPDEVPIRVRQHIPYSEVIGRWKRSLKVSSLLMALQAAGSLP